MNADEVLWRTGQCIEATVARAADLVASIPDTSSLAHESSWTLRDLCAHLIVATGFLTDIAQGTPSPLEGIDPAHHKPQMARWNSDIPETDPGKLSRLLIDAVEAFLDATSDVAGSAPVLFHGGFPKTVAGVAGVLLGEVVLHGYDIAAAVGRPWVLAPTAAQLVLAAYAPALGFAGDPVPPWRLNLGVDLKLQGVGEVVVRFVEDGEGAEDGTDPVDRTIRADPVAFLMVAAGRLSRSQAIALGALAADFPRPFLCARALRGFCTSDVQNLRERPSPTGSAGAGHRRRGGGGA